jgi:DNA-binding transcriptional MerR regulator
LNLKKPSEKLMKMKELTETTGVSKGTIQYYIIEGLIPKPIKTHPNMAYYSQAHIDAIRLVKELQSKRFLPLSVIKKILKNKKKGLSVDEIRTIAEMDGKLFGNLHESLKIKRATEKQMAQRTGVELKDIKELEKMGILNPVIKGKQKYYDEDDIRFMECWEKLREIGFSKELGFTAETLKPHRDLMERLVEEETKTMLSRTLGKISVDDMVKMVEEGTMVLNTMIGLIRKRLILITVKEYAAAYKDGMDNINES